jgi:thiamine biosynthesis lipoprotein
MFKPKKRLIFLAFFYFCFLSACDNSSQVSQTHIIGSTMGTSYSIKILNRSSGVNEARLRKLVETKLSAINAVASTYQNDSEITLFNESEINRWLPVSAEFCHLLSVSQAISERSEGHFDITIGPLVNLWGFGPEKHESKPSPDEIVKTKERVGFRHLRLDCEQGKALKEKDIYVDLSAIAKGQATSVIADMLSAEGVDDLMVEIGGELTVKGKNRDGVSWRIAIEKPNEGSSTAKQVLSLSDVSIATSGDYRNYYELDGDRVSHTIDPDTGEPIKHKLASVTVIARNGALADGWATAFNVMGFEKGFKLAEELGIAAYFIVRDGAHFKATHTNTFDSYMVTQ